MGWVMGCDGLEVSMLRGSTTPEILPRMGYLIEKNTLCVGVIFIHVFFLNMDSGLVGY